MCGCRSVVFGYGDVVWECSVDMGMWCESVICRHGDVVWECDM